jgi:hypothetical protein
MLNQADFNFDNLLEITGNDSSILKEFIVLILKDVPPLLEKLEEAYSKNYLVGVDSVSFCIHKLKMHFNYLGRVDAYDTCCLLEARLENNNTESLQEDFLFITLLLKKCLPQLQIIVNTL